MTAMWKVATVYKERMRCFGNQLSVFLVSGGKRHKKNRCSVRNCVFRDQTHSIQGTVQIDASYCSKRFDNGCKFSGTETASDTRILVLHGLFSNACSFLDLGIIIS
jgi:hypothetical protein